MVPLFWIGTPALRFDKRNQVRDRLLHDARALDDLGQKHLSAPEQIAHHVHAVHERTFDHMDRARGGEACFLDVLDDVRVESVHERVRQALVDGQRTPGLVVLLLGVGTATQ